MTLFLPASVCGTDCHLTRVISSIQSVMLALFKPSVRKNSATMHSSLCGKHRLFCSGTLLCDSL